MARELVFDLVDENATASLAQNVGTLLRQGTVVALWGDLGAGKTSFTRALVRSLTHADEEVPSPTFTLVQLYDTKQGQIWHFDLYRLTAADEVFELGWDDAIAGGIVLVEWPVRLGGLIPHDRLDVVLELVKGNEGARRARLIGQGKMAQLIAEMEQA